MSRAGVNRGRTVTRVLVGVAVLALLAAVAGCGLPGWIRTERTVRLPGPAGERSAIIYHPASAKPGAPLVVVLHGAGGNAKAARFSLGFDALARRDGFVVAYADALDGRWNAGKCCRGATLPPVDDVEFMHALRELLVARDKVDPRRVYAIGASNGGMLAMAWACRRPGELAAIGVVAGGLGVPCPAPAPLTVVAIHGTDDDVVPIRGGASPSAPAWKVDFLSLDESLAPFRAAAGCPATPELAVRPPSAVATWRCRDGHEVVRDVITGAGHGWPPDSTGFVWGRLREAPLAPAG